jgi:oxygen-dependent protoporphyrinogen oxidase
VELATLVLDAPELDVAPRGTGMLVAEGAPLLAKAMTHATAKWRWLQEAAGPGRHVVRVSYGRPGGTNPAEGLTDDDLLHQAVRDAATMFDMPLAASQVVAYARTRWINAVPHALRGQKERLEVVEECVSRVPGLEVTGSWIAGTGLASVIPNAKEAASRVRGLRWRLLTEKD